MRIYEPYITVEEAAKQTKFTPREEQTAAINQAFDYFKKNEGKGPEFLWNAKMRFGKTVCALWLIEKLNNELGKKKVLILTHRPVVNASWYGDFKNIFHNQSNKYSYGTSKETSDESGLNDFSAIQKDANNGKCVLFFVSMQYLRRSSQFGDKGDDSPVKKAILNYDWDLVIIDEAHEGTQTSLGAEVIDYVHRNKTMMLYLSGTPFNLLDKFDAGQIYNWDYIKEQQYKRKWDEDHKNSHGLFDDEVNPYRELPAMNIFTFQLSEMADVQAVKDIATGEFSFSEFFRVKMGHDVPQEERGRFVHEKQVLEFLKKLCDKSEDSHYPFSNDDYRMAFRHTLWVVPGVKEAHALKELLEKTPLCTKAGFKVINVAGNNDDDEQRNDALNSVLEAMRVNEQEHQDDSDQTHTITLSCGRLTTGVTVRPWTAVLYMKGSETTNASTYMQTIFRVQSPHVHDGMMKSQCYVFDFAPERTLKMMAETAKYSRAFERKAKKGEHKQKSVIDEEDKQKMRELIDVLNLFETKDGKPVITQGKMQPIDCERVFSQLSKVFVDKVVQNGFDHPSLYNNDALVNPDLDDEFLINQVGEIFANEKSSTTGDSGNTADINHNELTEEQKAAIEEEKKKIQEAAKKAREAAKKNYEEKLNAMTPEEREQFLRKVEEMARKRKIISQNRDKLQGLSKRIPLMMYGANVEEFKDITIDTFTDRRFIDDASWNEFMPKVVTREMFKKLSKFYNPDIFKDAGVKIRQLTLEADYMRVEERIARLSLIFSWFKNPDKETVLTPWSVVNRHMSSTLGGYTFFDEKFKTSCVQIDDKTGDIISTNEPRFVDQGDVTKQIFGDGTLGNIDERSGSINTKVLEINSKTGLYPLYVAYSLYRNLLPVYAKEKGLLADDPKNYSAEDEHAIWDEVVKNNLYVICNTKMAERITRRTLVGFRTNSDGSEIKLHVKQDKLIARASEDRDALVKDLLSEGYWNNNKMRNKDLTFNAVVGNPPYQSGNHLQVYPMFYLLGRKLGENVSMIFPIGWQSPKNANNLSVLNNKEIKEDKQIVYINNLQNVFPGISGAEWVNIIYWKKGFDNKLGGSQLVYTDDKDGQVVKLSYDKKEIKKPIEIEQLSQAVQKVKPFVSLQTITSVRKPYGLSTDVIKVHSDEMYKKYGIGQIYETQQSDNDVVIYAKSGLNLFVPQNYKFPKKSPAFDKYKVFVPYAWGNMCETSGLGGAFSDIIVGYPYEVCTETYLESGVFNKLEDAQKHAKYLMTKFCRALLYLNKYSQHSTTAWDAIPVQDYKEPWWNLSIEEIDDKLFEKYSVPLEIKKFVCQNIQSRTIVNIQHFNK